jgi:hypothetical protein
VGTESIPSRWLETLRRAEELDPAIREALRPVYDRIKSDAPDQASTFAIAMIVRAMRAINPPPGGPISRLELHRALGCMAADYVESFPDHPDEGGNP